MAGGRAVANPWVVGRVGEPSCIDAAVGGRDGGFGGKAEAAGVGAGVGPGRVEKA